MSSFTLHIVSFKNTRKRMQISMKIYQPVKLRVTSIYVEQKFYFGAFNSTIGHHERFLKLNFIVNWLNNTHIDLQRSGSRESSGTCVELFNTSSALPPDSSPVCQVRGQIFLENAYRFPCSSWDIVSCRVFPSNQLHARDPLRWTRTIESVSYC